MKCAQLTTITAGLMVLIFVCVTSAAHADQHAPAEGEAAAQEIKPAPAAKKKKMNPHMPIIMYSNAVTVGSTRDFVADYSFRGVSLEYRYRILPELSVGILLGLQNFSEKKTGTETRDNGAFWGTHIHQLETVPLVVNVHYYWIFSNGIKPFAGTDIGAYYKWRFVDFGWGWGSDDKWHFALAPQIGVMLPVGGGMDVMLSSKFNYLVEHGDSPEEMFVSFHVGLAFME